MHLIKKSEIKAKRHVAVRSPHKLKEKIMKDEDVDLVDPVVLENRFSHRDYVIGMFSNQKSRETSIESKDNMKNFADQASEMVKKLEALKKAEIARLFKVNLAKHLDDRLKEYLRKVFRYAFGKKDSEELLSKFMKEKRVKFHSLFFVIYILFLKKVFDQKIQKALGGGGSEKQGQNQDDKMMRMAGLKAVSTARSGFDQKSSNRSGFLNASPLLPPLDQSRSTRSVRKNSFSNNDSMTKSPVAIIQINEY